MAPAVRAVAREHRLQIVSVEDVVAQHERRARAADEVAADDERLGQPVRRLLNRVAQVDSPAPAVAEQLGEARRVLRRRDQQDVADAREHQRR